MSAGLATRLRPFSLKLPKPLMPIMGVPVIDYHLKLFEESSIDDVVVNLHHQPQMIQRHLDQKSYPFKIHYSDETNKILGSAGGIANAQKYFSKEAFFYFNCGDVRSVNLGELEKKHQELKSKHDVRITLCLFPSKNPDERYTEIQTNSQGLITGIKKSQLNVPFFTGAAVLEYECIANLPEGKEADFLEKILLPAIDEKKAGVFFTDGIWADAGSPQTWYQAHIDFMKNINHNQFPKSWKKLIEEHSYKLKDSVWTTHKNLKLDAVSNLSNVFWGSDALPKSLVSNLVYYSSEKNPQLEFHDSGIGLDECFHQFK